jgi:hypothetical protein
MGNLPVAHLTDEDPDQPESGCDNHHEDVEEEVEKTITPAVFVYYKHNPPFKYTPGLARASLPRDFIVITTTRPPSSGTSSYSSPAGELSETVL